MEALTLCELTDTGLLSAESYSPFCLKAHRALRAAGLPYTRRLAARPDLHRAHNPTGQVPVLLVGTRAIADSTPIVTEVDRLSGGRLTAGLSARDLGEMWCWEEYADASLNGFLVAARWADPRNWHLTRDAYFVGAPAPVKAVVSSLIRRRVLGGLHARDVTRAGMDACWARFERTLDHLEARAPSSGYWMGTTAPSIADVSLFGQLQSHRTPLTPWQAKEVEGRTKLAAWLDRVDAATRTTLVSSDAHAPG